MESVTFDFGPGVKTSKAQIVHGPHTLVFERGKGPWTVPRQVWERVVKNSGLFKEVEGEGGPGKTPEVPRPDTPIDDVAITDLKYEEAIEEIEKCGSIAQLAKWKENEKAAGQPRVTVLRAIERRERELTSTD